MTAQHPFTDIEARLAAPSATGVLLTMVAPDSPFAAAGVAAGDIVVGIDGAPTAPSRVEFHKSLQKGPADAAVRRYDVLARDGARRTAEVALPARGVVPCAVVAGQPAWDPAAADDAEPDFSGLRDGLWIHLRNSLEETPAGYEVLRLRRRADLLDVEVFFRLGGDDGKGATWDYVTRATATLRLERGLPAVATAFWQDGRLVGDLQLEDGVWRGTRTGPGGAIVPVERPATAPVCPAYIATLLPLTMPLRPGARLTFVGAGDGQAIPVARERFECTGRETVKVDGADVDAWCFAQRHYGLGTYGGDERFYVTDDRRLVRADWGPNYAGCSGEAVPPERLNDGLPAHVRFEL